MISWMITGLSEPHAAASYVKHEGGIKEKDLMMIPDRVALALARRRLVGALEAPLAKKISNA